MCIADGICICHSDFVTINESNRIAHAGRQCDAQHVTQRVCVGVSFLLADAKHDRRRDHYRVGYG